MQQSTLKIHTRKEAPSDEISKNAKLLIRAGFINKHMAGVYEFLPLGYRSLQKIIQVIREEMNALGAHEVLLSSLQNPEIWKKTQRWDGATDEVWFKSKLNVGGDVGLGFTHEEALTDAMRHHISSYKDVPSYLYQFQTKFRNETRAKSGIMRTREFIMKDAYSFSRDKAQHDAFYEACAAAYLTIYARLGLKEVVYRTFSDGGTFSKFSDEFQVVCDAGEDTIYVCERKNMALNKEVYNDDVLKDLGIERSEVIEKKAVEVGNIFTLGTRFAEALDLYYLDEQGKKQPVFMGSYGIGPARLLGTIVEIFAQENGMILPDTVAPFDIHLVQLGDITLQAKKVYDVLRACGKDVLWDDRMGVSAGEKFADADLLGMRRRIIISDKSIQAGGVEYIDRSTEEKKIIEVDSLSLIFK